MKKTAIGAAVALLLTGVVALAQRPERNISSARHPNLARAQALCSQAFEKIVEAQRANEWDLGGHAQKAKDLLDQAASELKQAAEVSNEHGH
jgi:hypothetical protein